VVSAIGRPVDVEGRQLLVGASVGISVSPTDGKDTDTLLRVADESMYRVKLTHRSRRALLDEGRSVTKTLSDTQKQRLLSA
jgi:predicted signal transduction protein with EAL and GGDEF domain